MSVRVLSFESRRATEMASLIERQGGVPTLAPSMREVPLDSHHAAFEFAAGLAQGAYDLVVFMTGVGATALHAAVSVRYSADEFLENLSRCCLVVRGPKPTKVLRDWGLRIDHRVPEPNTWRELLTLLQDNVMLDGKRIAIQEYGISNNELYTALRELGADVTPVPIYRWALPEDLRPLQAGIRGVVAGGFDVLLFTSAQQVVHVLQVAGEMDLAEEFVKSARKLRIGSIGPTASERIREYQLPVSFEASPPKMGPLVRLACQ